MRKTRLPAKPARVAAPAGAPVGRVLSQFSKLKHNAGGPFAACQTTLWLFQ